MKHNDIKNTVSVLFSSIYTMKSEIALIKLAFYSLFFAYL